MSPSLIEMLAEAKRQLEQESGCPKCHARLLKGECPEHGVIAPLPQAVSTGAAKAVQAGE